MVLVVGGLGAILVRPRTWCPVCPMGTMQRISYRLGQDEAKLNLFFLALHLVTCYYYGGTP